MRGKVLANAFDIASPRITPAYAGKSSSLTAFLWFLEDHPRICGEKPLEEHGGAVITGSPPHMRGKECAHMVCHPFCGITPAYAGKSDFV